MDNKDGKAASGTDQILADAEALLKGATKEEKDNSTEKEGKTDVESAGPKTQAELDAEAAELSHGEKSKHGRQIKRLQQEVARLSSIEAKLDQLLESKMTAKEEWDDPEPELSEIPTRDEVRAHGEWVLRQGQKSMKLETKAQIEARNKYGNEYKRLINDYIDPDEQQDLYALLTDTKDLTFNQKLSDDPKEDFLANFRNATAHLQGKKTANVRGKDTGVAMGVNTGGGKTPNKGSVKEVDMSKWSAEEQQVAKLFTKEELAEMKNNGLL